MTSCPPHDYGMPHDSRREGVLSCPPQCPYRLWCERRGCVVPAMNTPDELVFESAEWNELVDKLVRSTDYDCNTVRRVLIHTYGSGWHLTREI